MRKFLFTIFLVGAVAVAASSFASGATVVRCGTKYTKACTKPAVAVKSLAVACHNTGAKFALPNVTFTSLPGIRSVRVQVGSKTVRLATFGGQGPQQYKLKGVSIQTAGLGSGVHTVTITVTDVKGKKVTRTLRFSICRSVPVFTG
jgi:hypothetical protein